MRRDLKRLLLGALIAALFSFSFTDTAKAQNGSLYLSPSSGNVSVGQSFSLVLRLNTGGTAINAAEGSVVFDQSKLSVTSVSKSGSVFSLWASEPSFSNPEGIVEFAGGIPNPGYSGGNGLVLTINFRAKAATTERGYTEIVLVSGAILANDGEGTNILTSLGRATYFIGPAGVEPELPATPIVGQEIRITSPTHPDQSKWYSNNNPTFKWDLPSGVREVLLVLSRRANSPPIISYVPPISEKTLTDLEDGVWYLNGRFRTSAGLGPTASFKFNVDTQPPSSFSITRLDLGDPTNPRPELLFESSDATSGIDRYEIKVGEGKWVKIEPSLAGRAYAIPLQKYGNYAVEIKAFDRANNSTLAKLDIKIEPIKAPVIQEITKEADEGQPIIIKGTAEPNKKIIIELARNGQNLTYESVADASGNWSFETTDLPAGSYRVVAWAQDERQAVSELSNSVETKVKRKGILDFIFKMFDKIVNILSGGGLFIAFIIALVGLVLALVELFKVKSKKWFKPIMDWIAVRRAQKGSNKQIEHIIKDIEKEMKFLHSMSKRRKLGPEESYLKNKMEQYLKTLKNLKNLKE